MGGGSSITSNNSQNVMITSQSLSSIEFLHLMNVVCFSELVETTLPQCKASWSDIITAESGGRSRQSNFLKLVDYHTKSSDPSGFLKDMFRRGSMKHDRNLSLVIIRFAFGIQGRSEFQVTRRLRILGREHARLGIREEHLRLYNNILLRSIAEHLNIHEISPAIMDWANLLGYVFRQMTFESFTFARSTSRKEVILSGSPSSDPTTSVGVSMISKEEGTTYKDDNISSQSLIISDCDEPMLLATKL